MAWHCAGSVLHAARVKTVLWSARRDPSEARAILTPHDAGCFERVHSNVTRTDTIFFVRHEVSP